MGRVPPELERLAPDRVGQLQEPDSVLIAAKLRYSNTARMAIRKALRKKLRMIFILRDIVHRSPRSRPEQEANRAEGPLPHRAGKHVPS